MFSHTCRVYYEDTDAGGVVYYANYLKFAERARTEWLRGRGFDQSTLIETHGIYFVVRNVSLSLMKPARLDDMLEVTVENVIPSGARITLTQTIQRSQTPLAQLQVELACVNAEFQPVRIPQDIISTI